MEDLLERPERYRETSSIWESLLNGAFAADSERTQNSSFLSPSPQIEQNIPSFESYYPSQDQSQRLERKPLYGRTTRDPAFHKLIQSSASSTVTSPDHQDEEDPESSESDSTLELVQQSELPVGTTSAFSGPLSDLLAIFEQSNLPHVLLIQEGARLTLIPIDLALDESTDVDAAPSKAKKVNSRKYLMEKISRAMRQHYMLQDMENPVAAPLDARELKLRSAFRPSLSDRKAKSYKPYQLPSDFKQWHDGFDAKLFARSHRLPGSENMAPLLPYKLSGKLEDLKDFYGENEYFRRRDAFKKLLDVTPLNANAPAAPGFIKLATAFFNGEEIDAKFDDITCSEEDAGNAIEGAATECLDNFDDKDAREIGLKKLEIAEHATKLLTPNTISRDNHVITYRNSAWTDLADQMQAEADLELDERCAYPFKNNAHKALGLFLQDVIIANVFEEHCVKSTRMGPLKVFRRDDWPSWKSQLDKAAGKLMAIAEATAVDESRTVLRDSTLVITQLGGRHDENFREVCQSLIEALKNDREEGTATAKELTVGLGISEPVNTPQATTTVPATDGTHNSNAANGLDNSQSAQRRTPKPIQDLNNPEHSHSQLLTGSAGGSILEKTLKAKRKSKSAKARSKQKKLAPAADQAMSEEVVEKKEDIRGSRRPDDEQASQTARFVQTKINEENCQSLIDDYKIEPKEISEKEVDDGWQTVKAKVSQKPRAPVRALVRSRFQAQFHSPMAGQHRDFNPQSKSVRQNYLQKAALVLNPSLNPQQNNNITKHLEKSAHIKPTEATKSGSSPPKAFDSETLNQQPRDETRKLPIFDEDEFPAMPSKQLKSSHATSATIFPSLLTNTEQITSKATTLATETGPVQPDKNEISKEVITTKTFESSEVEGEHMPVPSNDLSQNSVSKRSIEQDNTGKNQQSTEQGERVQPSVEPQVFIITKKIEKVTLTPSISVPSDPRHLKTVGLTFLDGNIDIEGNGKAGTVRLVSEAIVDNSLSWAGDALSSPSKFESGSRRTSLPGGSYRPSEGSIGASPLFRKIRPRSKSMNTSVDPEHEQDEELSGSSLGGIDETVSNDSPIVIDYGHAHSNTVPPLGISIFSNEEPAPIIASNSLKEHAEVQNQDSEVIGTRNLAYVNHPNSNSNMAMPIPLRHLSVDHGHPNALKHDNQAGYHADTSGGNATLSKRGGLHSPGKVGSATLSFGTLSGSSVSSRGAETPIFAENEHQNDHVVKYRCSFCNDSIIPSLQTPLVFCPGCGPKCNIRYCSIACLLVDAYDHTFHCMNYPASERAAPHNLPHQFIYEMNPIISMVPEGDSEEKHRQKAFSMYCRFGPFPNLLGAWAKRNPGAQGVQALTAIESRKLTGDYHIFSSRATSSAPRLNGKADVIFTVLIAHDHPMKNIFNRCLNACFVIHHPRIVEFLFRMIRSFLIDPTIFQQFPHYRSIATIFTEFNHQFKKEFGFDAEQQLYQNDFFDFNTEIVHIRPILTVLEAQYTVLQYWNRS